LVSLVLTGLRGFDGSPCLKFSECFDPVSRDEADSSDKELSDARLHKMGTASACACAQQLESAKLSSWCREFKTAPKAAPKGTAGRTTARQVLAYLRRHPNAEDTLKGITQ
jgi:hypothetical protein